MCVSCKEIRRKYNTEVKNRFEVLGDIEDPQEEHDMILETYRDAWKIYCDDQSSHSSTCGVFHVSSQ